ncbi:hypothetical protein F2Q68_00003597 [Brassica cretica]|uniref:Uncharacterized protein n=1 Tax=Brassica cretica TaxID=69181 RepID=A0A8S9JI75_BRACR|nr:hypothetical protein F2Q68_00003597 [Brassica cretica]
MLLNSITLYEHDMLLNAPYSSARRCFYSYKSQADVLSDLRKSKKKAKIEAITAGKRNHVLAGSCF